MVADLIYLVHFETPYKHARHYLGYTGVGLVARFRRHLSNAPTRRGSALMRQVINFKIGFKVVRTWAGDRNRERRLKASGHARRCPVCCGRITYREAVCLLQAEREPRTQQVASTAEELAAMK